MQSDDDTPRLPMKGDYLKTAAADPYGVLGPDWRYAWREQQYRTWKYSLERSRAD